MSEKTSQEKAAIADRVRAFLGRRGAAPAVRPAAQRAAPPVPPGGIVDEKEVEKMEQTEH